MKRRLLISACVFLLLFSSCSGKQYVENELLLSTICTITTFDARAHEVSLEAFDLIAHYEKVFSRYDEESELYGVNKNAYDHPVVVSDELFDILASARDYTEATEGAFNYAIGPLVSLWGIGTADARIPSDEEIASVLGMLDWNDIILDESERSVSFLTEGMEIDLGGIAKGWISRAVASFLEERGVEKAIVNLGGNVYVVGSKAAGEDWTIGLQDPSSDRGGYFTTVRVSDCAVVTSGAYERFIEDEDGKRYSHILSSATGRPVETDLSSVSIISPDAAKADAYATACFALGLEKAEELCRAGNLEAVFLTSDGRCIRLP